MIDSFKIGEVVNDNLDTIDDESRSVNNTNNNEDAINIIFKYDEN